MLLAGSGGCLGSTPRSFLYEAVAWKWTSTTSSSLLHSDHSNITLFQQQIEANVEVQVSLAEDSTGIISSSEVHKDDKYCLQGEKNNCGDNEREDEEVIAFTA